MLSLDSFFAKFRRVLETTKDEQEAVAAVVSEQLKITIPRTDIIVKNGDITISGTPALKSNIFMKKAAILAALDQKFPKKFRSVR